jgi:beta-phosphoglucomutase-like phosphatase (HAD superfamily)
MNRIAVDIDEVLMAFVKPMAHWKGLKLPRHRGYTYVYRDMFKISEAESKKMVREFYETEVFKTIQPLMGSQEAMRRLKSNTTKMYAVTGRQDMVREKTETWLDHNFPGVFDDLVITNSYTDKEISKLAVCHSLNLDTIIDDNEFTCLSCAYGGMNAIHFAGVEGSLYPWCDCTETSVLGWDEVV